MYSKRGCDNRRHGVVPMRYSRFRFLSALDDLEKLQSDIVSWRPGLPTEKRVLLLCRLSRLLLATPVFHENRFLHSLGFHFRESKIRLELSKVEGQSPRGVVFQVAPSSTPITAVYSTLYLWAVGNLVITRLSHAALETVSDIFQLMEVASRDTQIDESDLPFVISYDSEGPYSEEVNKGLSRLCDLRLVWGRDEVCDKFNSYKTKINSLSFGFSDRFSIGILNADYIKKLLSVDELKFISKIYNDIFEFDNSACSSPKILFWIGRDAFEVSKKLYVAVDRYATTRLERNFAFLYSVVQSKFRATVKERYETVRSYTTFTVCTVAKPVINVEGPGCLIDYYASDLSEVLQFDSPRLQTLINYGIDISALRDFVSCNSFVGAYRVVGPGEALDFSPIWDGVNILSLGTKQRSFQ